ncbi:hypothetical protein ACWN8V_01410 [Vagococcus elongatus]|uniref:Uncharacterized protein n=1 Tax=Vagococcus elongatus TaxID=180344 RepID=A0A430B607_9ENTE|nr:hypothetical protein [Vagococcus elongatus]RSU15752.1 hypothetical protein CBF29_01385 [Vagococcus elongatus]
MSYYEEDFILRQAKIVADGFAKFVTQESMDNIFYTKGESDGELYEDALGKLNLRGSLRKGDKKMKGQSNTGK